MGAELTNGTTDSLSFPLRCGQEPRDGDSTQGEKHEMKTFKTILKIGGIAIAALALVAVGAFVLRRQDFQSAAAETTMPTAVVTRGSLEETATATGEIQPHRQAQLSLGVSGTVDEVAVREGSKVQAGDLLIRLDTAALERAVAQAEQNLIIQEANLTELLGGASEADLASARAAVKSAKVNLENVQDGADPKDIEAAQASLAAAQAATDELLKGPDANSMAQAEANLRNAEATLQQAQASYDQVSWRSDIARLPQSLELEQATNNYEVALANYNATIEGASDDKIKQAQANVSQAEANLQKLLDSPTPSELASAESQLAQAEAQLASLLDTASVEKIAIAEAQVEQARINLEEAQENLAKASLLAPFDGVITAVHVAEGETAAGLAADLVDTNSLEVVLSVDEVDIGELAVGQPAIITLETWPDEEIQGQIVSIAPKSSAGTGAIVSYEVRLSLGETDLPVLIGMTANADLITAAKEDVLLVPNQAITPDRDAGKYYVNLVVPGPDGEMTTERVEVTIGLKDGDYTEITSGLQEGDRLSINVITTTEDDTPQGGLFGGAPPGGGGGSPFGR